MAATILTQNLGLATQFHTILHFSALFLSWHHRLRPLYAGTSDLDHTILHSRSGLHKLVV